MKQFNPDVAGSNNFISILKKAWPSSLLDFCYEDRLFLYNNLLDFCNSSQSFDFSIDEIDTICNFLYQSLNNYLNLCLFSNPYSVNIEKSISSYLSFMEYLSIYGKGEEVKNLFTNTLNLLLSIPKKIHPSKEQLTNLFSFYDNNSLFCKICLFTSRITDYIIDDEIINDFAISLRSMPQETRFCMSLYPFNNRFLRNNFRFYPDECSVSDLYWGIILGYFSITAKNNTYKTLVKMCESAPDSIINVASIENPIYVFWNISNKYSDISILNHRNFIDKLFCH